MKIAYLISAYKDPVHLKRLISALSYGIEDSVSFFIHVDAKVDINPFIDKCKAKNVYFTDKRYWVQWGGYSQVMYQMELLRLSLDDECHFDRFVLITGQDYPLVSNEKMMNLYEEYPNKQYIKGLDKTLYHRKSHHQFTLYHFLRDTKFRNPKIKQFFSYSARMLFLLLPIRKKPYVTCNNQKWHIWQSSSYMSLTRDCAKYVFSEMQNNKTLSRYFKYSFVPEEKMIPTIIFNSK